ncbi:MAG: hypothetical protein NT049_15505, partial [Planctomycetota bacterium]|nr:hypothetical protein [Planctomycetota bacterium]
ATMAALCARSIAATMRAVRGSFVGTHRTYFTTEMVSTDTNIINDRERPAEYAVASGNTTLTTTRRNPGLASTLITKDMRTYNPNMFLYEAGRKYETTLPTSSVENQKFWPQWNAGSYVPVIYVTPIVPTDRRSDNAAAASGTTNNFNTVGGPFRVTIVIFKSRGTYLATTSTTTSSYPDGDTLHPRTKSWKENAKPETDTNKVSGEPSFVASGGSYIIDRTRHSGECYLIDFAHTDSTKTYPTSGGVSGNSDNPPVFLACGYTADGARCAYTTLALTATSAPTTNTTGLWYPLPGAVAAFHTIIGD